MSVLPVTPYTHCRCVGLNGPTHVCSDACYAHLQANPDHQNNQGQTALHFGMTYGFFELGSWMADKENGAACNDGLLNMFELGPYDGLAPED